MATAEPRGDCDQCPPKAPAPPQPEVELTRPGREAILVVEDTIERSLILNSYPPEEGEVARLYKLWGEYYRLNFWQGYRIVRSFFLRVKDRKVTKGILSV